MSENNEHNKISDPLNIFKDQGDRIEKVLRALSLDERYINYSGFDEEEDDFFPINPSGSVLMPNPEPYNKAEKMREANLSLKSNEYTQRTTAIKVTFAPKKTIFVYNGETYSFQAGLFPFSIEDTKFGAQTRSSSSMSSTSDFLKSNKGNETKILVVKVPNTESGELSSVTDDFENDDVCIPMSSCTFKFEQKKLGNEIQEQVAELPEECNDEENQILEEEIDNNTAEESESGIENSSGVLIKITSADSFESDVTDCSVHNENEEDQNTALIKENLNNNSDKSEFIECNNSPNIQQNTLKKSQNYETKSNKKFFITNEIKNKHVGKNNKKSHKSLDENETKNILCRKTDAIQKSKIVSTKTKSIDIDITPFCSTDCSSHISKERPKSCVERKKSGKRSVRPFTAPVTRTCCQWGQPRLPEYNGLRSEYGLSAEQLIERKRIKTENNKARLMRKQNKIKEEEEKRKQNEAKFCAWLENKREQAHQRYLRNQHMFLEANSITTYPAPTSHLKKMGSLRSRKISKIHKKCISLEEILVKAKPCEEKTYRIYLGVSVD